MSIEDPKAIMANPKFKALTGTRSLVGIVLTLVMLVLYYGFVAMIAFDQGGLATIVMGKETSLGIVLGIALLAVTFLLVALYVVIANSRFDKLNADLRKELGL